MHASRLSSLLAAGLTALVFSPVVVSAQQPAGQPAAGPHVSNGLPVGTPETTGGIYGEPLQRYDVPYPWFHGYFQEIPPYEGYAAFRPYNYKHVFAQSQAAGGWGMSPQMPYAQQFWHRYRKRALMMPDPSYSSYRQPGGNGLLQASPYSPARWRTGSVAPARSGGPVFR